MKKRRHAFWARFFADEQEMREIERDEAATMRLGVDTNDLLSEIGYAKQDLIVAAQDDYKAMEFSEICRAELAEIEEEAQQIRADFAKEVPRGGLWRSWGGRTKIRMEALQRVEGLRKRVRFLGNNAARIAENIREQREEDRKNCYEMGIDYDATYGSNTVSTRLPHRTREEHLEMWERAKKEALLQIEQEREKHLRFIENIANEERNKRSQEQEKHTPAREKGRKQQESKESWLNEPTRAQIQVLNRHGYRVPPTKAEAFLLINDNSLARSRKQTPEEQEKFARKVREVREIVNEQKNQRGQKNSRQGRVAYER